VADVVEAMSSHRPYRPALGMDAAIQELSDHPQRYDPTLSEPSWSCTTPAPSSSSDRLGGRTTEHLRALARRASYPDAEGGGGMRTIIGVMGGAVVDDDVLAEAFALGELIAERQWVLLNGGRNAGIMEASARGAHEAGGLVVGILPGDTVTGVAADVDIAIPTGMGDARNAINVLASHVVIAMAGGPGTVSEIALALKAGRQVVLLGFPLGVPFSAYYDRGQLFDASTAEEAIAIVESLLTGSERS
jgi:uncharacterized protein (TIGR00725 family)